MNIFDRIEKAIGKEGVTGSLMGWTSLPKANTYAAIIMALRPLVTLELGVWCGRGSIAMALAHKEIGVGTVYAVDAWSAAASVEGQINEADRKHWSKQDEHDAAYQTFIMKVQELDLINCVKTMRVRSLEFAPPEDINFAVLDGNHGDIAIADVQHYAPHILPGGFCYLDDLDWTGGGVKRASELLKRMGFKELYPFETGMFYQRI